MKKLKYFLTICLLVIITTGCVRFNATMNIKKDKSMDFSIIYAFDKTIFGETNKLKKEDLKEAEKEGFTIKEYKDGNYEGFTLTKKITNIDEVSTEKDAEYNLSGMMEENQDNKYLFKVVKGTDKNTYTAKFKFDANDSGMKETEEELDEEPLADENEELTTTEGSSSLDDLDFSGMMGSMDLSFTVNLPYGAISNNATKAEDGNKKLTWSLTSDKKEYIEFAFELKNNDSEFNMMYVYIGAGVLALIVIAVLVATLGKKKNNGGDAPVVNNTYTPQPVDTPEPQKVDNTPVSEVNETNNQ